MKAVVSDTGPLHYLILIDAVDVLPKLFRHVLVPEVVAIELSRPATPSKGRIWLETAPAWLERRAELGISGASDMQRGAGERAALALA